MNEKKPLQLFITQVNARNQIYLPKMLQTLETTVAKFYGIEKILSSHSLTAKEKQLKVEECAFSDYTSNSSVSFHEDELITHFRNEFKDALKRNLATSLILKKNKDLELLNLFLQVDIICIQQVADALSKYKFKVNPNKSVSKGALAGSLATIVQSAFTFLTLQDFMVSFNPDKGIGVELQKNPIVQSIIFELEKTKRSINLKVFSLKATRIISSEIQKRVAALSIESLTVYCCMVLDIMESLNFFEVHNVPVSPRSKKLQTVIRPSLDSITLLSNFLIGYKNLPCLTKPPLVENSGNLNYHKQYLSKRAQDTTTLVNKPQQFNQVRTVFNESSVKAFNHLQRTPYRVNEKMLECFTNNIGSLLEKEGICIHKYSSFNDYYAKSGGDTSTKSGARQKAFFVEEFRTQLILFQRLVEGLCVAHLYKGESLYFPVFWDFRGRFFYRGWPINPQGSETFRAILQLEGIEELVQYDASCSVYQLLGAFTYDPMFLKIFGFLPYGQDDESKYECMYSFLDDLLFVREPSPIVFLEYPWPTKEPLEQHHIDYNLAKNLQVENTYKFIEHLRTSETRETRRPFVKKLTMCYAYGQEAAGLSESCQETAVYMNSLQSLFPELYSGSIQTISRLFCAGVIQAIRGPLKTVKQLNYCLSQIVKLARSKNSGEVCFLKGSLFESWHSYREAGSHRTRYTFKTRVSLDLETEAESSSVTFQNQRKSFTSKRVLGTSPLSLNKFAKASMPNIIHQMDATLLHQVVGIFADKKIPIWVIHDCFIVPAEHEDLLKSSYNDCLEKMFFKKRFKDTLAFKMFDSLLQSMKDEKDLWDNKTRQKVEKFMKLWEDRHTKAMPRVVRSSRVLKLEIPKSLVQKK